MADILYGVKKVVLTELDPATQKPPTQSPKKFTITTAEQVELEPVVSEGEEKLARTDDRVLAVVRTHDIVYGYDFTLKDNAFDLGVLALVQGGKTTPAEGGNITAYEDNKISEAAVFKPFQAEIFVANYEGDSIKNYVKITLHNCTGVAPKISIGKDFYAPEFKIKAREASKAKLAIRKIEYVESLA